MIKIGIVGATGMVGGKMLELLTSEYSIPNTELVLFGSARSAGKIITHNGVDYMLMNLNRENLTGLHYVLFAASGEVAKVWCPVVAQLGGVAIDNSSHFRMDNNVPLIVPEVNPHAMESNKGIIANPNCSTIQAMVVLAPLDKAFGLTRVIYTTYQAVSGSGKPGMADLEAGQTDPNAHNFYPYPIYNNLIPHIDLFMDNDYTKEEMKMINETRKILGSPSLPVTCTAVRVPIRNCHSIAINVEFKKPVTVDTVRKILSHAPGITLTDDPQNKIYPMPLHMDGKDHVAVGRIRMDDSSPNTINLFCVADNLRKGAATNAVQILGLLVGNQFDMNAS